MEVERRVVVIFNPLAGMGRFRINRDHLVSSIGRRARQLNVKLDLEVRETGHKGDCQDIATEAAGKGPDVIAVAGGDGTIMEAVNSLAGSPVPLGIIPIGSGNDDIVSISGHNDMKRCVDDILKAERHLLDTGLMNGVRFLNVVGIGLDAEINHLVAKNREQVKRLGPAMTYTFAAIRTLLRYRPHKIHYELDGKKMGERDISLCTIGNGTTCGGGYRLTPKAKMDDGMLDLSISGYLGKTRSIVNIRKAFKGEHIRLEDSHYHNFNKAVIEGVDGDLPFHMDGEAGFARRIELEIEGQSLATVHPLI